MPLLVCVLLLPVWDCVSIELHISSYDMLRVIGAGIGGMNGFYNGLKETKAAQLAGAVWRTQYVCLS